MTTLNFDGLIFDMDGVLVDVSGSYREVIRQTAGHFLKREVQMSEVDTIKNQPRMNNDWDATYVLINSSDISYEQVKAYFQKLYLGDKNQPGFIQKEPLFFTKEQLQRLKTKYQKLGIATGRPKEEALYAINSNNLGSLFDCVIGMEDTARGKPAPDPILAVINNLGLKNTIYIGDSPSDVMAAEAAGIPSIYIGRLQIGTYRFSAAHEVINFLL